MATQNETVILERAAKYICTFMDGMCPMAVESYPCPTHCTVDTVPWRCWISYFSEQRSAAGQGEN